jgi:hypothetical protein
MPPDPYMSQQKTMRRNERCLNSYNAGFILGWMANIDFCPVINKEAIIAYVAKYTSKGETPSTYEMTLHAAISRLEGTDAAGIAYQKLLSTFSSKEDISGQETCHILLGCSLVKTPRKYRNLSVLPNPQETLNFANPTIQN